MRAELFSQPTLPPDGPRLGGPSIARQQENSWSAVRRATSEMRDAVARRGGSCAVRARSRLLGMDVGKRGSKLCIGLDKDFVSRPVRELRSSSNPPHVL